MRDQRGALLSTEQLLGDEFDKVLSEDIPQDMADLLSQLDTVPYEPEQPQRAA